jgi:predicted nucleic acid-binding Zn ribbon protein
MASWRSSPRRLGAVLDPLRATWEPETLLAEVQRVWAEVVGPIIAAEAHPSGERGGVVTVDCSASVWAQELDLMGETIAERLNRVLGGMRVQRLRCVTMPPRRVHND